MNPQTKIFKPGVHLFRENDRSRQLYIIQSGNVKIFRNIGSKEVELSVLSKGSVLGEMALIDGRARSASAKALDECCVSIIDPETFHEKIKGVPPWFMSIIKMTCTRIRNANRLLQSRGGGRHGFNIILLLYYHFSRYGTVLNDQTSRIIAKQLGTSEQNVARILTYLHQQGFIMMKEGTISLIDKAKMAEYCDFLRMYFQKRFERLAPITLEIKDLIHAVVKLKPAILNLDERSPETTEIDSDAVWDTFVLVGLQNRFDELANQMETQGLWKCLRKEIVEIKGSAEKNLHPLSGLSVHIINEPWSAGYMYSQFITMVPLL